MDKKVAIITGASSGIGLALSQIFISNGFNIAVCARDKMKLENAFKGCDSNIIYMESVDVAKEEQVKDFIKQVTIRWGRIDVLINNAGMSMRSLFEDVDISVLKKLMDINFWGTIYCTKYALPSIIKSKGSVVGISSIAGYRGLPARVGYSASKFAMNGFLESLRTELLKKKVHVMIASPGFTASNIRNTSMTSDGTAQTETPLDESKLMSAEQCAEIIYKGIVKRKRTIIMTTQGIMTVWMNKLFPKWLDGMVYNHFKNEPNSPLKEN